MKDMFTALKFALPVSLILWALVFWLLLTVFPGQAHADDAPPTPATEWVYQTAAFADMLTTLDIKHHPASQVVETNVVLGQRPSDAKVIGYFATTGALHYLFTRELVREHVPSSVVQAWEALGIGLEVGVVAHNYSMGVRINF